MIPFGLESLMTVSLSLARRATKCLPPGAVALYLFNEGSGQILHDYSGNGNHGILGSELGDDTNDPTWTGQGLAFETDDYILLPGVSGGVPPGLLPAASIGTIMLVVTLDRLAMGGASIALNSAIYIHSANNLVYQSNGSSYFTGSAPTAGVPMVHSIIHPTGHERDTVYRQNLGAPKPIANEATAGDVLAEEYIGRGAASYLDGTVHAAVYWPRALTDAELTQAYTYLKGYLAKFGVVLP